MGLLAIPPRFFDEVEFTFDQLPTFGVRVTATRGMDRKRKVVRDFDSLNSVKPGCKIQMSVALWALQEGAWEDEPSFADAPETISELRAQRERKGRHLSPRDPAVMFLRDLDAGKLPHAEQVVVAWRNKFPEPREDGSEISVEYIAQSGDIHTSIGMLEDIKMHMVKSAS